MIGSLKGKQYMHAARCPESPEKSKRSGTGRVLCRRDPRNCPRWTLCVRQLFVYPKRILSNRCRQYVGLLSNSWDMLKTEQKMIDEDERLVYPFQITTAQEFWVCWRYSGPLSQTIEKVVRRSVSRTVYLWKVWRQIASMPSEVCTDHQNVIWLSRWFRKEDRTEKSKEEVMAQFWENHVVGRKDPESHGMIMSTPILYSKRQNK
jgi:hypothetical protein